VTLDTLTWQMLASVFWPGSFIRCVVNATTVALALAHVPELDVNGRGAYRLLTIVHFFTLHLSCFTIFATT
jgi:hypothetical protein